mmetsp:Transcript_75306/g.211155  ORF Transcript_75306/g.211155 Transcript_75306/m.211155 type:complete len:94 (+) Transcript_75306:51-332(+)
MAGPKLRAPQVLTAQEELVMHVDAHTSMKNVPRMASLRRILRLQLSPQFLLRCRGAELEGTATMRAELEPGLDLAATIGAKLRNQAAAAGNGR